MSDIFISYSRKNIDLVSSLAIALEELGYSVWWDISRLHGGQQFAKVIQQEINKAQCVIVVWSKASVESKWVHAEASLADGRDILLTTCCEDAVIPLPFNTRHNENLRAWNGNPLDEPFQKLLQAVTKYCPTPSQVPPAQVSSTQEQPKKDIPESPKPVFLKQEQKTPKKPISPLFSSTVVRVASAALVLLAVGLIYTQYNGKSENPKLSAEVEPVTDTPNTLPVDSALATDLPKKSPVDSKLTSERLPFEPEMVSIPAGFFTMGCIDKRDDVEGGCYDDEKPAHKVNINVFQMGKYEITVGQYMACVDADACPKPAWKEKDAPDYYKKLGDGLTDENYPIVGVSWNNAQAYVVWLKKKTGKPYRLPTEAEWEYAARGGDNSKAYPWGNKASHDYMNYGTDVCCGGLAKGKDKWEYTSPVGRFPANGFGLYDMHGSVWEWVQDGWHSNYKEAPVNGEAWQVNEDSRRVLRGGSWSGDARILRSADRYGGAPGRRYYNYGFRLALGQ